MLDKHIVDIHGQRRTNPGKGIGHEGDQSPVTELADRITREMVQKPPDIRR